MFDELVSGEVGVDFVVVEEAIMHDLENVGLLGGELRFLCGKRYDWYRGAECYAGARLGAEWRGPEGMERASKCAVTEVRGEGIPRCGGDGRSLGKAIGVEYVGICVPWVVE